MEYSDILIATILDDLTGTIEVWVYVLFSTCTSFVITQYGVYYYDVRCKLSKVTPNLWVENLKVVSCLSSS